MKWNDDKTITITPPAKPKIHPRGTYLVILGFMLGSLRELLPHGAGPVQTSAGMLCTVVGFVVVYWLQSGKKYRDIVQKPVDKRKI